ncbi:MAG: recombinase [Candidatus Marinimicrobia bacterium]|jgi:DNA repair exonuclease SbcCD nuclease subunit|nr:recombinase [Candidatus Neomarinimicrobiota bacterium]|tara:strand:- start:4413 stop:5456 length:1044 start_codon:yes stop_codon:yes gene_type:complete
MKVAIITDTHFGGRRCNKTFHDYFQRFYEDVFFPTLEEQDIKAVIHMGDAFDNRRSVDFWALNWAKKNFYNRLNKMNVKLWQLVGNHDAYYKNSNEINAIESLLEDYSNIVPITEAGDYEVDGLKWFAVPWICTDNKEQTMQRMEETKAKVVFGHLELNGFKLHRGNVQTHGADKECYNKFDYVFSGHYHTKSSDGHIFYLGNPYQLYWNDVDDQRGFHILDTETFEMEYILNPYTIFEVIHYEDTNPALFNATKFTDKIVKVIVRKKTDPIQFENFIDKLFKANVHELKIIENLSVNDEEVDFDGEKIEDTVTLLNKYVDDSDFELDKEKVKKLLEEVYTEACEMI